MLAVESRNDDHLLNEAEAARFLRVSIRTLQAWRTRKVGPEHVRLGRLVRYRFEALLEFISVNTRAAQS